MHCKYLPQDLHARLSNGIIRYEGMPVWVQADGAMLIISDFPRTSENRRVVDPTDPLIDISSPKLGYVNTKVGCTYVSRKPIRAYKQSLTTAALDFFAPNTSSNELIDFNAVFLSQGFRSMLLGQYPSLEQALTSLKAKAGKEFAKAISRNVALSVDSFGIIRVFFKREEVGYIKPDETVVRIPSGDSAWIVSKFLGGFGWEID